MVNTGARGWGWMRQFLLITNAMLMVLVVYSISVFGSVERSLRYLAGERIFIDSPSKTVGQLDQSDSRAVSFRISNLSRDPVEIIGANLSCTCLVTDELPIAIGPRKTKDFHVRVEPKGKTGRIKEKVVLFTTRNTERIIPLEIVGDVSSPSLDVGGSGPLSQ